MFSLTPIDLFNSMKEGLSVVFINSGILLPILILIGVIIVVTFVVNRYRDVNALVPIVGLLLLVVAVKTGIIF